MADDDVLLQAQQIVLGPADRRVGQHPVVSWKEAAEMNDCVVRLAW